MKKTAFLILLLLAPTVRAGNSIRSRIGFGPDGGGPPCVGATCNDGDALIWDDVGNCWDCGPVSFETLCNPNNCDFNGDIVIWNETGTCYDCIQCNDGGILRYDTTTNAWLCDALAG